MEHLTPQENDYLVPDGWNVGESIKKDDGYKDGLFPGCDWRIPAGWATGKPMYQIAINLKVTGGPRWSGNGWKSRVKIEWVKDDREPSEYSGGWLFFQK